MPARSRLLATLILVIVLVALSVCLGSVYVLYRYALAKQGSTLLDTVNNEANLIGAVARYDTSHYEEHGKVSAEANLATIGQIVDAYSSFKGFGETGEFTMGRLEGDHVVFAFRSRLPAPETPEPVTYSADSPAPIWLALHGESGLKRALDYRGVGVLAAYAPVPELGLGIVAKIDIKEIRGPFLQAGAFTVLGAIVIALLGILLVAKASPLTTLLAQAQKSAEDLAATNDEFRLANESQSATLEELIATNEELEAAYAELETSQAELKQSSATLSIRSRIANTFLMNSDDDVYADVLEILLEVFKSDFGVFGYISERGDLVVPSMSRHIWDQCDVPDKAITFPRDQWGDSIWPCAIRQGELLFSNEPSTGIPDGHVAITRNLVSPIKHNEQVIGMIQVANKATDYDERDIEWATIIAEVIAPILDARLSRDRAEAARQQAEAELVKHRDHLEELVEARTGELQAAEAELREISDMQQIILDTSPVSIWLKDTNNGILSVNKAVAQFTGIAVEDMNGKSCYDLFPEEAEGYYRDDLEVLESGQPKLGIVEQLQTVSGEKRWICTDKIPYFDAAGKIKGLVLFVSDITQLKQAEEDLRVRTVELEAVNKELESFAYSVSHDLRAPLRAVDGFSLALLEDYEAKLDETGQDYLHRVRNGAQRMAQLIDDVLALSRVTRATLTRAPVDLSGLANRVAAELQATAPARSVDFRVAPDLKAKCDRRLVEQVMENLLGNSWKFTGHQAQPVIEFGVLTPQETLAQGANGTNVYFIRDNGAGFDMQYSNKLFTPFQRLHHAEEFPGTGIGLASVQRIVHRHGGKIWAAAEVGQGATFYFTLK